MADFALPQGSLEDEADSEPQSPLSPGVSNIRSSIAKSSLTQASEVVVHRVNLANFDETVAAVPGASRAGSKQSMSRAGSKQSMSTPEPGARMGSKSSAVPGEVRRMGSKSSLGGDGDRPGSAGRGSSSSMTRQTSDGGTVRALTSQEVVKRNKDAVAWFSNAKNVNKHHRSIEDTEDLLQKARDRREKGGDIIVRRESKQLPLEEPKQASSSSSSTAKPGRARRTVDAASLWGPKPVKKKEPDVPVPEKKSCMRGDVQVGSTGENGLLARLRRRSTIN